MSGVASPRTATLWPTKRRETVKRRLEPLLVVLLALAVVGGLAWQSFGSSSADAPTLGRSADAVATAPDTQDAGETQDTGQIAPVETEIVYDWVVSVDELPDEAIDTLLMIDRDGPYPYSKDGSVFQNREGLLPDADRGYYREFTVDTPGSPDRGARRIVAGDRGELFYTADHYDSFAQIIGW